MTLPHPVLRAYGCPHDIADTLPTGTHPSRVLRHDGSSLLCITTEGPRALRASPGLDPAPAVGDWVAVRPGPGASDPWDGAAVAAVLPRSSLLRRQSADGSGPQVLAANVDTVLVVCGADRPLSPGRVQRVSAQSWDAGAEPVLVLTKVNGPAAADLDRARIELEHPGMRVLITSALEGVGLDELHEVARARTSVLVGESGAGKSTLTNALLGRQEAATGQVRASDAKGRHTTSARQLHLLPGPDGGVIIDTPGLRSLGLFADGHAVDDAFAEILELAGSCRFTDCGHVVEPGCAVLAARDEGTLSEGRYASWLRLQREAAALALRSSPHELSRHNRKFSRMVRRAGPRSPRGPIR
jgi:ribosome biogenesis GTPase